MEENTGNIRRFGPASLSLDLDRPGKRSGWIELAVSDNTHAFSVVRVPVGVVVGRPGPTALLLAGSHGDEYEGQAILHRLMQVASPDTLTGRLIMLPALNAPAVLDRARVSPLDAGNMNRAFPGTADGGPTAGIAGFVNEHLIGLADLVMDLHSGGTSAGYVDCAFLCLGPDDRLNAANTGLARIFGAPFTMVTRIDGSGGDSATAALRHNVRFLGCELGGLGSLSVAAFNTGWRGTCAVLAHAGLGLPCHEAAVDAGPTRFLDVHAGARYLTAAHHGLARIHLAAGDPASRGDTLATLFDIHNFGTVIAELQAPLGGVVAIRRRNPLVSPGDHLCLIAPELDMSGHTG